MRQLSTLRRPLSTVHCPLSTLHCALSTVRRPCASLHCKVPFRRTVASHRWQIASHVQQQVASLTLVAPPSPLDGSIPPPPLARVPFQSDELWIVKAAAGEGRPAELAPLQPAQLKAGELPQMLRQQASAAARLRGSAHGGMTA